MPLTEENKKNQILKLNKIQKETSLSKVYHPTKKKDTKIKINITQYLILTPTASWEFSLFLHFPSFILQCRPLLSFSSSLFISQIWKWCFQLSIHFSFCLFFCSIPHIPKLIVDYVTREIRSSWSYISSIFLFLMHRNFTR